MATSWLVDSKAATIERQLAEVQTSVLACDTKVLNSLQFPNKLSMAFNDILYNKDINACYVLLMPDTITNKCQLLYATKEDDGTMRVEQRVGDDAYVNREHFKETRRRKDDYWSNPYADGNAQITTFCHPLTDTEGNLIGVLCADVLLDNISEFVKANARTSNSSILENGLGSVSVNSKTFILSRDGHFVSSPDSTVNINETYETYALRHKCPDLSSIGKAIINNSGKNFTENENIKMDGEIYHVAYSTINKVDWTVVTLYPTEGVSIILLVFFVVIVFFTFIGVVLLVCIIYYVIQRSTRPLKRLVTASEAIAHGNFDVELPKVKHSDEVKTLSDSFEEMRLSLKDYVVQLKETTAHNERMEQDLAIASHIQMSMLPDSFPKPPEFPELSIFAYLKPTREVGGDLYDFFIRRQNLYFIVGDVSGKGVPAAMIMSMVVSMFRARQRRDMAPERTVKALNNMLLERNTSEMFVTMIVGDLNLETGELYLCNAGHNPPILNTKDGAKYLELKQNIPIGIFPNYHYQSDHFHMNVDDKLFLYTDGVTEATNEKDLLYGEDRLLGAVKKYGSKDVEALINSMINDLGGFTGETPQSDDITMLELQYHGSTNIVSREMPFSNNISEVTRATALIEEVCEQLKVDFAVCTSLQLALEEAMVNVINYAYENGRANIDNNFSITSDGKSITFVLTDNGMPFDPTKVDNPDTTLGVEERTIGGLGIFLVKNIMDSVTYKRHSNRNILTMTKNI